MYQLGQEHVLTRTYNDSMEVEAMGIEVDGAGKLCGKILPNS